MTLRLLAGGDNLDLGVIFDIGSNYCNTIMFDVLRNWIILYDIGQINMMNFLSNLEAMAQVSAGFSERSNGVLIGVIGALDGWLVRIVSPSWWTDSIKKK